MSLASGLLVLLLVAFLAWLAVAGVRAGRRRPDASAPPSPGTLPDVPPPGV